MGKHYLSIRLRYKLEALYDLFRYDFPRFIKNIWRFRKQMWEYRPWDYGYTMDNLRQSLYLMSEYIDKRGLEVDESRRKKVYYMKRCIHLIDLLAQDDFHKQAEINLGKKLVIRPFRLEPIEGSTSKMLEFDDEPGDAENNWAIWIEASRLQKETWYELFDILKGEVHNYDVFTKPELKEKAYEDYQNGKGIMNWWD